MLHIDNLNQVQQIVYLGDYSKLLDYKEFHLEKLSEVLRYCQDIEIQKHILNNAIDLESKDMFKYRPIHYVCYNENGLEMLKILIQNKVNL